MTSNNLRGVSQDSIQSMNRTLIAEFLRERKVCSRANLAKLSGLKEATATYTVNDFISWGCVREIGLMRGGKGRRSIGIILAEDSYYIVDIRLARRNFKIGLFSINGRLTHMKQQQIESEQNPDRTMKYIINSIHAVVDQAEPDKVLAIGMAIPGPFIKQEGKITVLTETAGWGSMTFKEELGKHFSYPAFMEHDANAGAYARIWCDKAIDKSSSLIYVAMGQGMGADIVHHSEIIKGGLGIVGEVRHTAISCDRPRCECGNRGCLEEYCSSIVLAGNIARKRGRGGQCDLGQIEEMIEIEGMAAMDEFQVKCRYLGYGLMNVVNSFNPSMIILGDEMSHVNDDIVLEKVDHVLKGRSLPGMYSNLKIKVNKAVKDSIPHGIGAICTNKVLGNLELYLVKWICRIKYVWKDYG